MMGRVQTFGRNNARFVANRASATQSGGVGGNKSLAQPLSENMKVNHQWDGSMSNMFVNQTDKMGEWKTARHVLRPDRPQPTAPVS